MTIVRLLTLPFGICLTLKMSLSLGFLKGRNSVYKLDLGYVFIIFSESVKNYKKKMPYFHFQDDFCSLSSLPVSHFLLSPSLYIHKSVALENSNSTERFKTN